MKWSHVALFTGGLAVATARYLLDPFPSASENPVVALMALHAPDLLWVMHGWYAVMPGAAVFIGGMLGLGVWRVWFESAPHTAGTKGGLPPWPVSAADEEPAIVVGETHHRVEAREIADPEWLVIPERGLYTGVAIFGAVGSGKTSACMHPFARQLFGWQAGDPGRRASGLVLEVKGDFCYDIREILEKAGRKDDYIELGLDGRWQWNPLSAHWLDSYSLAYTVSTLLNQLFGKGKDPFWQQAYTNLVKWIIELYRIFPDRWVTLQDVYRCAINPDLFQEIDRGGFRRGGQAEKGHFDYFRGILKDTPGRAWGRGHVDGGSAGRNHHGRQSQDRGVSEIPWRGVPERASEKTYRYGQAETAAGVREAMVRAGLDAAR